MNKGSLNSLEKDKANRTIPASNANGLQMHNEHNY